MIGANESKNRNVGSTQSTTNPSTSTLVIPAIVSTTGSSVTVTGDPKYKKIYRSILEKVAKLNEIYKSDNAFLKLFQNETTILRDKLKKYCEMMIIKEPIEYGKKVEEILWRRVFYEIIQIVKQNKKNLKSNIEIETMYRLHLTSAYGFYNQLILKLQTEFSSLIQLNSFLDFPIVEKSQTNTNYENADLLKEVLMRIIHKLLLCLGDLARYQIEYDPCVSPKLAQKYYQMSLILLPNSGMPLNQLGTLYDMENYGCDATYYYLYCLSCNEPNMIAKENLKYLFSKNRKRFNEINSTLDKNNEDTLPLSEVKHKEIKKFLVLFLHLIDTFLSQTVLFQSSTSNHSIRGPTQQQQKQQSQAQPQVNINKLQELCQQCLLEFNSCLFYKSTNDLESLSAQENIKVTYLSDQLVFKLVLTIIMTVEQLKSKKSTSSLQSLAQPSTIYFTCVAFALLFFSHVLNHTIIRIQESLLHANKESQVKERDAKENADSDNNDQDDEDNIEEFCSQTDSWQNQEFYDEEEGKEDEEKARKLPAQSPSPKTNKKNLSLIYSRRRRNRNSDSDDSSNEQSIADSSNEKEGDKSSKRTRTNRKRQTVARFLERDNLSETELNVLDSSRTSSTDSSDSSDERMSKKSIKASPQQTSPSISAQTSSNALKNNVQSISSPQPATLLSSFQTRETPSFPTFNSLHPTTLFPVDLPNVGFFPQQQTNFLTTGANVNFKEFSTQIFSYFQEQQLNASYGSTSSTSGLFTNTAEPDFIDNEIYKFVLNGSYSLSVPPGFNPQEAKEIEELGKKIAAYQIETDTEVSVAENSTSNESSADEMENESSLHSNIFNLGASSKNMNEKSYKLLVDILQSQGLLSTVKVFCDWLLCNKRIIQSISQVSTTLWSKMAIFLNCIPLEKQIETICDNAYVKSLIAKSSETKSWNCQPLSEDVHLRSFSALRLEHMYIKFDLNKLNMLTEEEEHLLRLCCLRRFGYLMASLSRSQAQMSYEKPNFFEYDFHRAAFKAPKVDMVTSSTVNHSSLDKEKSKEDRKLQLMNKMAQLRLQAEISQLDSSANKSQDNGQWSPYLVPDTFSICNHLRVIQDLSRTNKFIIIIPLIVIDNLDRMKKSSKLAREAIRWLEIQFKQGNRFLRVQNQNEKIVSNRQNSNVKNKDMEQWNFYQLIDCCCYLQQESNNTEDKSFKMVTLLLDSEDERFESQIKDAKQKNIEIVLIQDFYQKWKKTGSK